MFGFDIPLWLIGFLGIGRKIVGGLFSFFTTKPGCYVGIALLVIGAAWVTDHRAYNRGIAFQEQDEATRVAAATAKALADGIVFQVKLDKGLSAAADKAGFLRGKAQAQTIYIKGKVPDYVTAKTDVTFPLPCGLIRLHDAAALGVDPETLGNPAGLADDAACPVKASALASLIVDNYGLDHEKDAQIIGLQDLARGLAEAISGVKVSGIQAGDVARDTTGMRGDEAQFEDTGQQQHNGPTQVGAIDQRQDNVFAENLQHQ